MFKRRRFLGNGLSGCLISYLLFFATSANSAQSQTGNPAEPQINNPAVGWDHLWHEVIVDITIIGILFSLITLYFMFKYRRREPDQEGNPPKLSTGMAVGWAVIPIFVFMADDLFLAANGWQLWNDYRRVPAERMEIQLESGMYSWDYTYPNGVQTQNELIVPAGKPIMLRMTSRDTLHSHYIPDFRVKEDSMPGRVTYLWFYPTEPGKHVVSCGEYCGIMHSYMVGYVIVKTKEDFDKWYNEEEAKLNQKASVRDASVAKKEA